MAVKDAVSNKVLFINPEQAKRCLAIGWDAGVPLHFIGAPQVAKTSFCRQFVEMVNGTITDPEKRLAFLPFHMASHETGEFMLPMPDKVTKRTEHYPTTLLPFDDPKAKAFVLFDDLTKARPELQPFVMNVMLDRFFCGHSLSQDVYICATSNAGSDMFNSDVCVALRTRACNLYISAGTAGFKASWQNYAESVDMLPETRAFLEHADLNSFTDFEEWSEFGVRTLEMVDKITKACRRSTIPTGDIYLPMIAGLIGRAEAIKYQETARLIKDAPSVEEVVANPKTAKIPDNVSVIYALTIALQSFASRSNAEAIGEYAVRLPVSLAWTLIKKIKDKKECDIISHNKEVQKWTTENRAVML